MEIQNSVSEKNDAIGYQYKKYIEQKLNEENGGNAVPELEAFCPVVEEEHAQQNAQAPSHAGKNKEH